MKDTIDNVDEADKTFEDYLREARDEFVVAVNRQDWNTELRVTAENLLNAYDQCRGKLASHQLPVADDKIEKAIEWCDRKIKLYEKEATSATDSLKELKQYLLSIK